MWYIIIIIAVYNLHQPEMSKYERLDKFVDDEEEFNFDNCKKMFLYPEHYPENEGKIVQVWVYNGKIVKRVPMPEQKDFRRRQLSMFQQKMDSSRRNGWTVVTVELIM